jgi:CHAT domain-containing protein
MIFIRIRYLLLVALALSTPWVAAVGEESWAAAMSAGIAWREQGHLDLSIGQLNQAAERATNPQERMRAKAELGVSLVQARHLDRAKQPLLEAYAFFSGIERARVALDLGNLALLRRQHKEARHYYAEVEKEVEKEAVKEVVKEATASAAQLSPEAAILALSAQLNGLRLPPLMGKTEKSEKSEKWQSLNLLYRKIASVGDAQARARLYLNLGSQAQGFGKPYLALAFQSLDQALRLLSGAENTRLRLETLDALAQLYEEQGRAKDALTLTRHAMADAATLAPAVLGELAIGLEWRQARLQLALGQEALALASFQRAVAQIERLRQDLPIEYEDGRSYFHQTLEPVYLGLAELLLKEAGRQSGPARAVYLRRARDTVELIKQSELQDYLGDRCTVEALRHAGANTGANAEAAENTGYVLASPTDSIPAGTAILYPVIFKDRIELLLETSAGIERRSWQVSGSVVREAALSFAADLRDGEAGYLPRARQLYDWLLRPFEAVFAEQNIKALVVVPDGALRLVALGALHDGSRFAIEKFAISTLTGLSITNTRPASATSFQSLLAGVSEFGPVVDKLEQGEVGRVALNEGISRRLGSNATSGLAGSRTLRAIGGRNDLSASSNASNTSNTSSSTSSINSAESRTRALRAALALPGVKDEIAAIRPILPGASMLDAAFTVDGFRREAEAAPRQIIHIASHGVFGGAADSSYILAYDDILTLDGLQSLLKADQFRKQPLELLTLSACETAEGNDRSPLGIAGAAIKARAKSVLGTLWPVDDNAARKAMEKFYRGLMAAHLSKTEALRQAQIELLRSEEFSHPFFWAPFLLVGNWL